MIDHLITFMLNIVSSISSHFFIKAMSEDNTRKQFIQSLTWATIFLLLGLCIGTLLPSCSYTSTSKLEKQVRQWAKEYPSDLRDRWAWCYLDSAENWSTDTKLREDVRLKSTQVLTATERETLTPLDQKISQEIPKQKMPLKETYYAVGNGLKVTQWSPPPSGDGRQQTTDGSREPQPPIRRKIFRRL
jgi:hypothetical protein